MNNKNMKLLGIMLVGILLITLIIGTISSEIYVDINSRELTINQGPNTAPATAEDMARGEDQFKFMESNWDQASEEQKRDYVSKRYPEIEFEGDLGDKKLNANGDLVNKDGKTLVPKSALGNSEDGAKVIFEGNGDVTFSKVGGLEKPTTLSFNSDGSYNIADIAELPTKPTTTTSTANPAPKRCGPTGCYPRGNTGAPTSGTPGSDPLGQSNPFQAPQLGQQGGGFGGGIGGGAGGGSPTPQLDQAAQIGLQMAGSVAGLVPKPEDETPTPIDNSGPSSGPGFAETYLASLSGGEVEVAQEGVTIDDGAIVAFQTGGQQSLVAGQTDTSSPASIQEGGQNNIIAENLAFVRPNELAAETTDSTTVGLNGISGNSDFRAASTSVLSSLSPSFIEKIKELFPLNSLITGKVIGSTGQSIELIDHDLRVDGHDMNLYPLKTFNEVEFGGNNLHLFNGDIHMSFNGQRIMYSRLVNNAPYGIKRVSNKLDINQNRYTLQHYEDHLGELYDENHIIYVGDVTSQVGKGPYARLLVNRDRLEMFS